MLKKCVLNWLCDFYVFQNDKKLSNGFKNFTESKKIKKITLNSQNYKN